MGCSFIQTYCVKIACNRIFFNVFRRNMNFGQLMAVSCSFVCYVKLFFVSILKYTWSSFTPDEILYASFYMKHKEDNYDAILYYNITNVRSIMSWNLRKDFYQGFLVFRVISRSYNCLRYHLAQALNIKSSFAFYAIMGRDLSIVIFYSAFE